MASITVNAPATPLIYRVPLLGAVLREWAEGDADYPLYLVVALVSIWGIAIMTWGLPALYLPAVAFSPIMLMILVLLTRG
jgi:hypothetical protein